MGWEMIDHEPEDPVDATPKETSIPAWWRAHDVVVGLLAGLGVGVIAGLFATRIIDTTAIVAACGVVGAVFGVLALWRSRQQPGGFVTAIVVIAWAVLAFSAAFLTALAVAIANFE